MSNDVESILAFCKNGYKVTAYDLSLAKDGLILLFPTDLTDFRDFFIPREYPIDGKDLCESFSPSLEGGARGEAEYPIDG